MDIAGRTNGRPRDRTRLLSLATASEQGNISRTLVANKEAIVASKAEDGAVKVLADFGPSAEGSAILLYFLPISLLGSRFNEVDVIGTTSIYDFSMSVDVKTSKLRDFARPSSRMKTLVGES